MGVLAFNRSGRWCRVGKGTGCARHQSHHHQHGPDDNDAADDGAGLDAEGHVQHCVELYHHHHIIITVIISIIIIITIIIMTFISISMIVITIIRSSSTPCWTGPFLVGFPMFFIYYMIRNVCACMTRNARIYMARNVRFLYLGMCACT